MNTQRFARRRPIPLFTIIILSLFTVIAVIPFIWVLMNSFKSTAEIFVGSNFLPVKWLLKNYPDAWRSTRLGLRFYNSIIVTVGVTALALILSTISGYSFAKMWLARKPAFFYVYFFGMAIPSQAIVLSIFLQLRNLGLHNTLQGLILAIVGTGAPFATFLMRNFFRNLPKEFGECAQLDGAGSFRTFLNIYLPLAKPGLMALAIFVLIGAWNEFDLSLVILSDDKNWTVTLGITRLTSITSNNYGQFFAAAVICFVPVIVLYVIFQRSFIEGITVGGSKG